MLNSVTMSEYCAPDVPVDGEARKPRTLFARLREVARTDSMENQEIVLKRVWATLKDAMERFRPQRKLQGDTRTAPLAVGNRDGSA